MGSDNEMLKALMSGATLGNEEVSKAASHSYTGTKGRIVDFLGSGCAPGIVASAVGVEASYISQLLADEEFAGAVTAIRLETLRAKTERDGKYDHLEDKLLEALENVLAFMTKPRDILHALGVVNAAKRRGTGDEAGSLVSTNVVVSLTIASAMLPKFTTNKLNQVIEVEGQTMVTLPSGAMTNAAVAMGVIDNEG